MGNFGRLLADNASVTGRLVTTAAVVVAAGVVAALVGRVAGHRRPDPFDRYVARKLVRYVTVLVVLVALAALWRPFAGRLGVVLGFITAGVAFAMQEVIGALAGWISIATGHLYRVGDRVEVGGVRGDVIDISPLRTKLMEIGSSTADDTWVRGRQLTGRLVSVSNRTVFSAPVFNFSAAFDFLWEEFVVPIPYDQDWREAQRIIEAAVSETSARAEARGAIDQMRRSYPMPDADLQSRVFVRLTDNWVELTARFVVPVRTARGAKDAISRTVLTELERSGIGVASATSVVTVRGDADGRNVT